MMWLLRPTSSGSGGHLSGGQFTGPPAQAAARADRRAGPVVDACRGMVAVTELVERLDVIGRLDAVIGPIKHRRRSHTGGQLLVGIAAAQLAGEDFLVGLDRQRADTAGQQLAPVPDLAATTAAGLARRLSTGQCIVVESGLGDIATAAMAMLPADRAAALSGSVTIDLNTTDVEVYG